MNTHFLETFVVIAEEGSMAAAARRLDISAAAVAQQIQALEHDIGAPLLARAGRTVHLTEQGHRILAHARELLRGIIDLRTLANDQSLMGELRIGAGTNALYGIVPGVLAALIRDYPQMTVFIQPGYSPAMHQDVVDGKLDAAIVLEAPFPLPKSCEWQLLREEPYIVLAPASLAGEDAHALLSRQPFIRYDHNQWGGREADAYLRKAGIVPRERFELNSLNAIAVMVDKGLGVSLVPQWIGPWPEGLRLARIPLPVPFAPRRLGVIWSRASSRLRLVRAFTQEALRVCQALQDPCGATAGCSRLS